VLIKNIAAWVNSRLLISNFFFRIYLNGNINNINANLNGNINSQQRYLDDKIIILMLI